MKKPQYFEFTKKQLDSGIKLCKERAKQFALDAKLLAENDSLANALGLYTIALEEFRI